MDYLEIIIKIFGFLKTLGYSQKELSLVETNLKANFPDELSKYYLTFGKNKKVNESFNRLLKPKLEIGFSDDRYLVFYEENQGAIHWGIREADLILPNPPVFGNYDATYLSQEWFLENTSLSNFLLSMALWNAVLGGLAHNAIATEDSINDEVLLIIEGRWKEIETNSTNGSRFFDVEQLAVIGISYNENQKLNGVFIGSNSKLAYNKILNSLPLEWEYLD